MITLNLSPSGSPSVQDNLWHIASSTNSGQTDFKYVFDIYVNGVQKIRVKQFPEPTNGKGYFDAGPTVRNSMTYAWFEPLDTAYVIQPDMSGQVGIVYNIRVGEDYSGLTTSNMASGDVSAYNWAPPLFKRRALTLANKLNSWLTNRPLTAKTRLGDKLFAGFYTSAGNSVKLYCNSGTTNVITKGFVQMNIGSTAINNLLGAGIGENIRFYDVWFNTYERMRVTPVCNAKFTPVNIHFLNRWGLYDSMIFELVSKLTMDMERKSYNQKDYRVNGNAVDYYSSANRYYEGKINHANIANWTYKLTTDFLTDAEYTWLADLIASPQILLEQDGYFYPVTIRNTNYEYSKYENNRLKVLDIDFEMNQTRWTQLR
jgi:hypothetical protein